MTNKPALQLIRGEQADERKKIIETLYSKYGGSILGRCRYLLKDATRAEDAMQDVFARALNNHQDFRAQASPLTWLMKIATNHCLNELRKDRSLIRRWFHSTVAAQPEPATAPQMLETRELIRQALSKFDLETQAAVIHYHLDEMTLEEVAQALGKSVPTIRKRLQTFARETGQELAP
jgi:RNA polymerase sigma-70 factor, ECF subfamily